METTVGKCYRWKDYVVCPEIRFWRKKLRSLLEKEAVERFPYPLNVKNWRERGGTVSQLCCKQMES